MDGEVRIHISLHLKSDRGVSIAWFNHRIWIDSRSQSVLAIVNVYHLIVSRYRIGMTGTDTEWMSCNTAYTHHLWPSMRILAILGINDWCLSFIINLPHYSLSMTLWAIPQPYRMHAYIWCAFWRAGKKMAFIWNNACMVQYICYGVGVVTETAQLQGSRAWTHCTLGTLL